MESEVKMQKGIEFIRQHSLTPSQRAALILEKFTRVQQYAQAQQRIDALALQKQLNELVH